MSKFDVKKPVQSVQTPEELTGLLEKYKVQNPVKYAAKLARGEFEKVAELPKVEPETKPEVKVEEKEPHKLGHK